MDSVDQDPSNAITKLHHWKSEVNSSYSPLYMWAYKAKYGKNQYMVLAIENFLCTSRFAKSDFCFFEPVNTEHFYFR